MRLIDKRAALKEQFPRLQSLMNERPGCQADRDRREYWAADNQARTARSVRPEHVADAQEADADRFIAQMRRREQERFLARLSERKTA